MELDVAAAPRDALALVIEGRDLQFGDLECQTRVLTSAHPRGGACGGACVLVADTRLETIVRILAALRARIPLVLLHPRLTQAEQAELLRDLPAPPAGTLAVLFTSGTTGRPKPVALSRHAFLAAAAASAANLGWRDDDRWLLSLPLAHVGGLAVLVRCLAARKPVVVAASGIPDSVTLASLVPTQLRRLVDAQVAPPPRLRAVLLGGAPASPALLEAARAWPVLPSYGLTEACGQVATRRPGRGDAGVGPPLPGITVRIAAGGAIEIAGPTVPGVLTTSDLGRIDGAGCLHVLGRSDDVIISGGENVHPAEVEACLEGAPGVVAACVYPLPDETWGQVVAAAVVPAAGFDEAAVAAHLRARLAPFKRPRRLILVDALPLTPSGKPDRRALAEGRSA